MKNTKTMKYGFIYKVHGHQNEYHYLTLLFDRQIVPGSYYRGSSFPGEESVENLLNDISKTPNVIHDEKPSICGAGLIHVSGAEITVKIVPFNNVGEIANQIAKKIQRRFAKGERRQRISLASLKDTAVSINY